MVRVGLALWFGMVTTLLAQAQSMEEAASPLAARISSLLQHRTTASLEFQNLTALPAAELSSFRAALEQELRKQDLELTAAAQPEARLRIVISENVQGLLLVAVVTSGDNRQIAMLPWSAPPPVDVKPRVRISMRPVREQPEAMLDILLLDSGSQLLVLGTSKISSYRLVNETWTLSAAAGLSWTRPLPRDPRGRIENTAGGLRVYVPGTTCNGMLQPEFKLTCTPMNEAWLANGRDAALAVRWVTDRNLLESDGIKGLFYDAAAGWFSNPDGRILDRAGEPLAGADAWGSDLASIENPCGPGWMVLASKAGDAEDRDQIQAYEIANGQAVAASAPVALPGPVLAIWPAETAAQATLVIRDSKTGNYEASRLGVACAE